MSTRPLPHFAHKPIGKTTHKKGFSYQNVNYITREDACSKILAGNMPDTREGARPYFEREAYKDGVPANARIADTLIIALPIELTPEQRHEAIAGYMDKIGKGRIAWLAAFHDIGKDEHNPHAHIIFRDADIETGRKVVGTTTSAKDVKEAEEHGWRVPPRMTTKDLRVAWCQHLNGEMESHGYDARFDQRTLKEQGIDREAGIHVGPKGHAMAKNGKDFDPQDRKRGDHVNVYSLIDTGSRAAYNQQIAARNQATGKADPHIEATWQRHLAALQPHNQEQREKLDLRRRQSVERKAVYAEQTRDRTTLREAHDAQKLEHQRWARGLNADARKRAFATTKEQFVDRWKEMRTTAARQRASAVAALKLEQKAAYAKAAEAEIAALRPVKNEAWTKLKDAQETERKDLKLRHTQEVSALSRQHIAERHALHEQWRDRNERSAAQKLSARFEARQGMAASQSAATSLMRHRVKTGARDGQAAGNANLLVPMHAAEATKLFRDQARASANARDSIRYQLNATRQLNQIRAAEPAAKRLRPGKIADQRTTNRAVIAAQKLARLQPDQQSAAQQAATSGRSLTDAERAAASPEIKAALEQKRDRSRREDAFLRFVKDQNSGKGRDGKGGSER